MGESPLGHFLYGVRRLSAHPWKTWENKRNTYVQQKTCRLFNSRFVWPETRQKFAPARVDSFARVDTSLGDGFATASWRTPSLLGRFRDRRTLGIRDAGTLGVF